VRRQAQETARHESRASKKEGKRARRDAQDGDPAAFAKQREEGGKNHVSQGETKNNLSGQSRRQQKREDLQEGMRRNRSPFG